MTADNAAGLKIAGVPLVTVLSELGCGLERCSTL